jgi:crossover junction endodeoxyribonuclease RuvC
MFLTVLGIDPGTRKMGFGVVKSIGSRLLPLDGGVVEFEKDLQTSIKELSTELEKILQNHSVDEVAMESLFFSKNPQSILKLAQFRGATLSELLRLFPKVSEYSPLEIKKSLTGNGKASKEQVNFMVKRILNISQEIKPLDISDALAVSITHIQRSVK